jgi:hypothetical protein
MFSLQRILGKEDKFFSLLEASARQAHTSVQALVRLSKALDQQPPVLDEFTDSRRKDKEITKEITEAVYTTFVTALEREDIDALSTALYKITKSVDKFSQRAVLAPQHVRGIDFSTQISLCDRATATLARNGPRTARWDGSRKNEGSQRKASVFGRGSRPAHGRALPGSL